MMKARTLVALTLVAVIAGAVAAGIAANGPHEDARAKAFKAYKDGNYRDAYQLYRKILLDEKADAMKVGGDLDVALQCLRHLNRVDEVDAFREAVIETHDDNWRLLYAAAKTYAGQKVKDDLPRWRRIPSWGYMIAGEYHRGRHRGGGKMVNSMARDRVRAMQLMTAAMKKADAEKDTKEVARFHLDFARMIRVYRGYSQASRLQYKTDLDELPDYDDGRGYYYYHHRNKGAPVGPDGEPVYYSIPESWEAAANDGERWRFLLLQAKELDPNLANQVRMIRADFLHGQFGCQTMRSYGWYFRRSPAGDDKEKQGGILQLHTLERTETIAKLATGIKRFTLPDEHNFIQIYRQVVAAGKSSYGEQALGKLAQIFENRRQYETAAETWRENIEIYGPGSNNHKKKRLSQIVDPWGMFEHKMQQPAGGGTGATVPFRFRNGEKVTFTAHAIKVKALLDDVKAYIRRKPNRLDWQKMQIGNLGYRLIHKNQKKYVGEQVAQWSKDLEPREHHFDRRITVTTPLQDPGAYLLKAAMQGGNTCYIVLWVNDTVIVKKHLDEATYIYVADAVTGKPVPKANVEFFGYRQKHTGGRNYRIEIENFARHTDADGQIILNEKDMPSGYRWILTARTKGGRFAHHGYTSVWYRNYHDRDYKRTRTFIITDRPVYRPDHTVKFKMWVRHSQYDMGDTSHFANKQYIVRINDAKGEKVFEKKLTTDEYGGLDAEYKLPDEAALGRYQLSLWKDPQHRIGGNAFRVEEYKKPEFEVTVDAPTEPVMLGEKITATIKAKYYFGAPVTKAKVKYKVERRDHDARWYPVMYWDWFYGPGYWWFAYDYSWYPGWHRWGTRAPHWWWYGTRHSPPELVSENEVEIGPDGTVEVEIDTSIAKEVHGDTDHKYTITAEVTDQSRRTIVGTGDVMVARKPFEVYAWVDRGHYRVGDTIHASFNAQTLSKQPVKGEGELTLYSLTYNEKGEPNETKVQSWELDTGDEGRAEKKLAAHKPGQYRLSYKVTDAKNHTIEGGYIFIITGEGFDGSDFRFNAVELVPDRKEYEPGENVKLRVNTNRLGSTVLLFTRPTNSVYLKPKVLRLDGKSVEQQIAVAKKDMPNFFVEAVTISGGKLHTAVREIIVPPEKRVLNVEAKPTKTEYKPGEEAKVTLQVTDIDGEPFVGSLALTVYDKSVEYISGGSNVPEIRAFFWKWRRRHHPRTESSLGKGGGNITPPHKPGMGFLGVFGRSVADMPKELAEGGEREAMDGAVEEKAKGRQFGAAAPAARRRKADDANAMVADAEPAGGGGAGAEKVEPTVRKKFADTALWVANLTTDKDGTATVDLTMPENLTGWKIKVWGMGHGTKVGQAEAEVVTKKNLLLRMQAPRFFVETDEVVLSANIHNYLKEKKQVEAVLELDGPCLKAMTGAKKTVAVDANGEQRVDWRVQVVEEGTAVVRMKALTDVESDAMQMSFPVYVHGMLKTETWSGALRPKDKSGTVTIDVPEKRRINESRLEIRYSPSLAAAMVDALPYLADYPHDTTDTQLNRFLPTVMTQKILLDMRLDLEAIRKKRINLNAQELGDAEERAKGWKRFDRNPVFDREKVKDMVRKGVRHITARQLSDGGWGWFSGWGEHSTPHITAYVVHGLQIAKQNDVAIVPGVLKRGVQWLQRYQDRQVQYIKNWPDKHPCKKRADNMDAFVYMVLVDAGVKNADMLRFLYRDRTHLAVYANAMLGLALHKQGLEDKLAMVVRNIDQYLVQDDENQTAYLKLPQNNYWWYWYGSEYEAQAYYLKLLCRTAPKSEKASRLVKYLLNNRKHSTYWDSPRDTAICVEAFADYLKATGEHKPDLTVQILIDGVKHKEVKITSENLFTYDNKLVIVGDAVTDGEHKIEVRKTGDGPLYFNAYLTNFTLEDFITKAGLEIKVRRNVYKLVRVDKTIKAQGARGQAVDQKVEKFERRPVKSGDTLKSGDLVEIELVIESKNDYEYIVFEDMKAAGFEPVRVRSGYSGEGLGAYMELRDEKVCFFVRRLARGKHSVSYRLRAEIPGTFSALPTRAYAMYAPELKGNSDEIKVKIED